LAISQGKSKAYQFCRKHSAVLSSRNTQCTFSPHGATLTDCSRAIADTSLKGKQQHDLFITDVEYDTDETQLGIVHTGTEEVLQGSTLIKRSPYQAMSLFAGIKLDSIVRFVSAITNTVTDYMMVRELVTVTADALEILVDAPVLLTYDCDYFCYLVRKWIARTLKLNTRFQLITACEVKAFAFTGISSGNLCEGITGVLQHDLIGLEIKEIPCTVKSTNRNMEHMLAVLPTYMASYHPSSWNDARDAMIYLLDNMAMSRFLSPLLAVNSITQQLVDRQGGTVRAARFHLWLRLWADVR
jgi:hypothetical protein